jgi:hypothetical protein
MDGGGDLARSKQDWKEVYKAAMVESDPSKLFQRISDALTAILQRVDEARENTHDSERQILTDAAQSLCLLQQLLERKR